MKGISSDALIKTGLLLIAFALIVVGLIMGSILVEIVESECNCLEAIDCTSISNEAQAIKCVAYDEPKTEFIECDIGINGCCCVYREMTSCYCPPNHIKVIK